jgi:metal-responsive CopG/Arc/MetJ family transcriptional regulator
MNFRQVVSMEKSTKVAVSLPVTILKAVEKERKAKGENRSEFFRRAVVKLLKEEQRATDVQMYIQGYHTLPESAQEVKTGHQAGVDVLSKEPW